jgi:protein-tyrosine kinase
MERIQEAIRLAKQERQNQGNFPRTVAREPVRAASSKADMQEAARSRRLHKTDKNHLEANRVIAKAFGSPLMATFDMLRTKVLQEMSTQGWQVLVMTSPMPGCGKTVSAINLALSIARQPEQNICLLDLDFRRPCLLQSLGVTPEFELSAVLAGKAHLEDAMFSVDIGGPQLTILGNLKPTAQPVEVLVSRQMQDIMEYLRALKSRPLVVVDMPPVLVSDDVLAFLPQADCCILSVAEGQSTVNEIENSEKLLANTNVLGCILTKSNQQMHTYY